jgi:hypothetical protein
MTLRAFTVATDIKGRFAGTVMAALTLASMGSAAFAIPAAAAKGPAESTADTIRSGPHPARPISPASATGARTAQPAVAPRIPSGCDSTFHQVTAVSPGLNYSVVSNNGMTSLSPTDVWAVGGYGDTITGPDRTLAMKWNGTSWSQVATPNIGPGHDDLWGVTSVPGATTDVGNVWTVGDYTDGAGLQHAQAFVSASPGPWTQNTPANIGNGNNVLFAVAAITASNVWAVGNWRQDNGNPPTTQPSPNRTLIGHWDGTAFTTVAGLDVSPTSSDRLFSVSASSASDVWAVGRSTEGTVSSNLILHYNGTAWSIVPSPTVGFGSNNTLFGVVALSPTLAYAVGSYVDISGGHHHTLLEQWNGTIWSVVTGAELTGGGSDSYLFSVSATSSTDIWAGGAVYTPTSVAPSAALVEHWDGTQWKIVPTVDGNPGSFNELNAIVETAPSDIWGGGDYVNPSNVELTLTERLCMSIPTVTSVLPVSGNATGGTTVAISGTDFNFASAVKFGATAATSFTINSNTSITATAPAGVAGTVDVTVTNPAGTSAVSPADTYIYVPPAISWQQYWLAGSDGSTWQPIDATTLSLTFTPTADSKAILSGNADLWTSVVGVNQDLGILVTGGVYGTSGTLVAWKESGGYAGTYSPNAGFVQTAIPVLNGTQYGARLVWKANKATTGTIFAAAGNAPNYSPTRLTAELVPTASPNLQTVATNAQYWLAGSNGIAWQDMDGTGGLTIANYMPAASGSALISVNADLWTATGGVNQDIGIFVSGGTYSTGTIVGWKESGGFAGTLSPNAAYAQTVIQLSSGVPYTIKVQWKANKNTAGTIYAAAGNAGAYSPTRLTLRLFPAGTGLQDAFANTQYYKVGSTGADWTPIDSTNLKLTVIPAASSLYVLSANADLWTATAGVNQDVAIFISGGAYGTGTLVAWKESGGFAGTFSPNAAFVQTVVPLAMGVSYTITLEWKANKSTGGVIYAAAGNGPYSPTRVTAQLIS